jgi:hypothetical protein
VCSRYPVKRKKKPRCIWVKKESERERDREDKNKCASLVRCFVFGIVPTSSAASTFIFSQSSVDKISNLIWILHLVWFSLQLSIHSTKSKSVASLASSMGKSKSSMICILISGERTYWEIRVVVEIIGNEVSHERK